jgi:hypothetical protein
MIGGQLGPAFLNAMPRWLLEGMTGMSIKGEDKKAKPGDVTMRMLAPTLHYDFELVSEMANTQQNFKAVQADMLLLGGDKSPAWLRLALDVLVKIVPHVKRVEFAGLDHGGSSDPSTTNRGGDPQQVAKELRHFFA